MGDIHLLIAYAVDVVLIGDNLHDKTVSSTRMEMIIMKVLMSCDKMLKGGISTIHHH